MDLPPPFGRRRGRLFESADSITLPDAWPGLETAEMYVDTNVPGFNAALALAARSRAVRRVLGAFRGPGLAPARLLGRSSGCRAVPGAAWHTISRATPAA